MNSNTMTIVLITLLLSESNALSASDTPELDSLVIENRQITASELADLAEMGKRLILRNDTITGDWAVGGNHHPTLGSISVQNSVFERQFTIVDVTVREYAHLRFADCTFMKGAYFARLSFKPWSNLVLTDCTYEGPVYIDGCNLEPLTEVLIDKGSFRKGFVLVSCTGEWLFRLLNSRIEGGLSVNQCSWQNRFENCEFEAGGSIEGDFSTSTFWDCSFLGTAFEMTVLPCDQSMGKCGGIDKLSFRESPAGLTALRDWYRLNGYRQREREATYALRRTENSRLSQPVKIIQWLLFDLTCSWGKEYGKPLYLAAVLILLLWPVYWLFAASFRKGDIYRHWVSRHSGRKMSISVHRIKPLGRKKGPLTARLALLFSVMSAFNIGFRDFDFGRWIRNITKNEYDLRALHWARTVSGIQALISVFLFALFLLTYFGRPFN